MGDLKHWLAIWLCWGAFVLHVQGQALPDAPPSGRVVDKGNIFPDKSGAFKRITNRLRELEIDHGIKIYIVAESTLITSTPSQLAADLRLAWIPRGDGLVLVFEADSRKLGIGRDLTGPPDPAENSTRVPMHETSAILARAIGSADSQLAPEGYLEALVSNLAREYDGYFNRLDTPPPAERSMKIGLLIVGGLSLLGLAAIAVGGMVRHSSMTAGRCYRFPLVDRPERLGAPCGASVTTRRFAPPASKS